MKWRWSSMAVGLVLVCAPGLATAQAPPTPGADPAAGAQLFRARGCITCHAADLPRFQQQSRSLYELAAAMWNHFPAMADRIRASDAGRPYLTSSEMRDVMAFLYSRDDPRLLGDSGDPGRGEQLVATKGCLACHAISGGEGKRGGSLDDLKGVDTPWSVVAQMWNHSFLMHLETRGQRTAWAPLTPAEMADLVAFLRDLMRRRG